MAKMKWSVGITTVPSRRANLFPRTLLSLRGAGFDSPRLFVDGDPDGASWEKEFKLPVTTRNPAIRTHGNWFLALTELYIREPTADYFAIFQDDCVAVRNLRAYMDRVPFPQNGYANLYTAFENENVIRGKEPGWYEGHLIASGPPNYQMGRSALGLVFRLKLVLALLASPQMLSRPQDPTWGWKRVDGGIVNAMNAAGYREYVHGPSLLQHTGKVSSMGNRPHLDAQTFPGEEYDALDLLKKPVDVSA